MRHRSAKQPRGAKSRACVRKRKARANTISGSCNLRCAITGRIGKRGSGVQPCTSLNADESRCLEVLKGLVKLWQRWDEDHASVTATREQDAV